MFSLHDSINRSIQWPERAEGLKNHQVERAGQAFLLLPFHIPPVVEQQQFKPIPVDSQHRKQGNPTTGVKAESVCGELKDQDLDGPFTAKRWLKSHPLYLIGFGNQSSHNRTHLIVQNKYTSN
jgi:hypothetical protein